ncbi:PAS domain-containing sensor histidine kinase [Phormidesmis sp. 146-35]
MTSQNGNDFFVRRIQAAYQRTEETFQELKGAPEHQSQALLNCLEELHVSLEELQVAQDELCQQQNAILEAQDAIESERQRYCELFEFAPDGYLITDRFGAIREANRAAAILLKINPDYLLGKPIVNFVPEANRRAFRNILGELPILNRVQEWEVPLQNREHTRFEAAITVETVRDPRGEVLGLRWLIRDITARKQAEEQLQQTQIQNLQLLEADRLRRQFIATVTHELRTPMNAILGFSKLLLRQFQDQGQRRESDMLERVLRNGQHLLLLIEDILDFSKLQANRLELSQQAFDLNQLMQAIVEELNPLAEQKSLDFQLHLPPDAIEIVNDRLRLRQIVINLLSNAIKFTDAGSVSLEVLNLPEGRIAIVIRDTGIGIDELNQAQIFREFWQVDQTHTRLHGGTGLGLSITKALVELMQGAISVESQVGVGTTFRVEIPRYALSC